MQLLHSDQQGIENDDRPFRSSIFQLKSGKTLKRLSQNQLLAVLNLPKKDSSEVKTKKCLVLYYTSLLYLF